MDTEKLDLNLLEALEALLAERNVTRAAKRLNLSQPALSSRLTRLRSMFGDELFVPTSRGVLPTVRALELQQPLREALDRLRVILGTRNEFEPASSRMSFALAGSDYVQVAILLPFLLELRSEAPRLRARVLFSDSRTVASELEQGDADVAFLQPERVNGALRSQLIFIERYVCIARKGSLASERMTLDRFLAADHVVVSPRAEGFRGATDAALEALGCERNVCFAVSSFVFLIEAVSKSNLIAVAPRRLALANADKLDLFDAPLAIPDFSIAMIWHDRTHQHPGHRWLRQRLADFCSFAPGAVR
ncbi:MAG: LysR family transcriptional regulator [Bradyrhizobium sp.]|uniref:LysR family transcriptional regulator n=1 Tax=Bradyrhizobium sp. TaxID=376 RepID=UPI001DE9016D|nr:LysR family transcriptional regulator [Bradyrhizobium sp.]MBV9559758.1 LysR family transcriptional regulator [Bradyrhizobium sp.]